MRQIDVDVHDELSFLAENAFVDTLEKFLSDKKSQLDKNHRWPDGETVLIRCVQGAQKIDLSKATAIESIKKFEMSIKLLIDFGIFLISLISAN